MNTIICRPVNILGMWLVKAQTPSGQFILVNHNGTELEAIEKARWAEAEPA